MKVMGIESTVAQKEAAKDENKYLLCPQNHYVPFRAWNCAKDVSDNLFDADGVPMFESGLYCLGCERAYGLSKLRCAVIESK